MNATLSAEPIAFVVTRRGRAHCRRRPFVRIAPTRKGVAAVNYLRAQDAYNRALWSPANWLEPHVPNDDAPEIVAARIVLTVAADAYREAGGTICEDCETLEGC